jgi:uncharacterized membrane protein
MPIDVTIDETPDQIFIVVKRPRSLWETVSGGLISAGVAYFFATTYLHKTHLVDCMISIAIGILSGLIEFKPRKITTAITKFEIQPTGSFGGGYLPNRHVPMADISGFEYREQTQKPYRPNGLYGSTCVVPFIDQPHTEILIDAIFKKFAHVLSSSAGSHFPPSKTTSSDST